MEILGIGPMELFFIVALALILMGPKDMAKAGKTIGKWLNDFVRSDTWKVMRETTKTVRSLPTQLMREANIEDMRKDMNIPSILPKFEDMDAVRTAPEAYRTPRPADPEAGATETTIIAPARSLAFEPGAPPPSSDLPTLIETPSKPPAKSAPKTSTKPAAAKKSAAPSESKPKRGKKADA